MDIRNLRYFIAISQAPSLSVAAKTLGVAQPSLSQHVTKMEQELGVQLLDRSPRGTVLTQEGRVLVRHAIEICASLDACVDEMRDLGGTTRGKVGFGMPPSVSMVMSVPLAETVRLELPDVRLKAVEAFSGFIKNWIEDETVQMGFLYDLDNVEHFRAKHILDERLYFFSAPDNWPFSTPPGNPVSMAQLAGVEFVLPGETHGLRKAIERGAASVGVSLDVVVEMDAMTQLKELVARGSGYTIFTSAAANDFVGRGELVRSLIVDPIIERPVYLVSKPSVSMSRACRAVEVVILKVANDLVARGIWQGDLVD